MIPTPTGPSFEKLKVRELRRFFSRSEGLQPRDRGFVERLNNSDHEIDGAVEVGTVDDSVVSVRGARRNEDCSDGNADIVELDGARVVPKTGNEIKLQGNVLGCSDYF